METRVMKRFAVVLGLTGFALVAGAGEPVVRKTPGALEAKVSICSPSWRLQVEKRLAYLEDQVDDLESSVDEVLH
jgi:hypothetical protein